MAAANDATVLMISAWQDDGGVRCRITLERARERMVMTCSSIDETIDEVRRALEQWDRATSSVR